MSTYSDLLTQTATIKRRVEGAVDDLGIPEESFTTVSTTAKCLIQQKSESVAIDDKGREIISSHLCFMAYGESVQEDDLITIGSNTYYAISVDNDVAGQGHHVEVYLRLVK